MSGIGKRIEEAVSALDKKQVKKALYLTSKQGMEKHRGWVEEAARTCLAHKDDPDASACDQAIKDARDKLQETITVPMETTDLEGLEEYLTPSKGVENMTENAPVDTEKTDEELKELYESCDVCHVADAAVKFAKIAERDECDGVKVMEKLQPCLDNQETAPETWLKTMTEVTEQATCNKSEYGQALGELTEYLQRKDSEILKNLDKAKY